MNRLPVAACSLILLTLVVLLLAGAPAALGLVSTGDGSWYWRTPQPHGDWLVAASSVGDTVWAAGEGGTIVVSHDGGETWISQHSGTTLDLLDIVFVDDSNGWAVGGSGYEGSEYAALDGNVILRTIDGGDTWQEQPSPGNATLYSVTFTDALHGWAAGEGGIVLSTADGGVTWARRRTGVQTELTAVHFVDGTHGWVGGPRGSILRTADGGRTWAGMRLPRWAANLRVLKPAFSDPLHGYAIFGSPNGWMQHGSGRSVAATDDGGRTWRRVAYGPQFTAVGTGPGRVWTAGDRRSGAVEYGVSDDGGLTWSRQIVNGTLPDDIVSTGSGACSVANGGAFSSPDGEFWLPRTTWSYAPGWTLSVTPGDKLIGFTETSTPAGRYVMRSVSSENGVTWELGGEIGALVPFDLEAVDDDRALVVGATQSLVSRVLATDDGGATWTSLLVRNGALLNDVATVGGSDIWVCGIFMMRDDDPLLFSPDGGQTWQERSLPRGYSAFTLDFISSTEGWAAALGERDTIILRTTDGGEHWDLLSASRLPGGMYEQLDFVDAQHGWAAGWGGEEGETQVLMRTSDGGQTWTDCTPAGLGSGAYCRFTFADALHGWAWDENGFSPGVLRTEDGGATWSRQWTGAGSAMSDVVAVGEHGFGVDQYGGVLSTADLAGDSATPYTYDDFDRRDHRTPVTVTLRAADVGGEVASTEYRIDDDPVWQPYAAPLAFDAPADHSGDGRHQLHYRSTDTNGNVEADFAIEVPIDTLEPSAAMLHGCTVARGDRATIPVRIDDATGLSAGVVLRFRRISDGRKGGAVRDAVRTNRRQSIAFRCRMLPGRYRVTVEATDAAGNHQVRAGHGLLVVKPAGSPRAASASAAAAPRLPRLRLARELAGWLRERYGPAAPGVAALLGLDGTGGAQLMRSPRSGATLTKR